MKNTYADTIVYGKLFTGDCSKPYATAMAICDGKFLAVGNHEEVAAFQGPSTRILDCSGRRILPGMTEGHAHVTMTADLLFGAHLYGCHSVEEYLTSITRFHELHRDITVLTGKGYITSVFGEGGPTASLLDKICPDIPAVLSAEDCHSVWVNSLALELLQINELTPDDPLGEIVRYPDSGKPTGWLKEAAADLVAPIIPAYSIEEYKDAILAFQETALSNGITNCFEPLLGTRKDYEERLQAYHELDLEGRLVVTFQVGYPIASAAEMVSGLEQAQKLRDTFAGDSHIQVNTIKLYADGVLENHTAALLDPYADQPGDYGTSIWAQNDLNRIVLEAQERGFRLHAHAIGDGAVEQVLRAYENAHNAAASGSHPDSDLRHAITHLQIMKPDQIVRMAKQNILAVVNPYWHFKDSLYFDALEIPYLGIVRAESEYPLASLVEAGVHVSQASDWPVTVPANTFLSLHLMVNRTEPGYVDASPLKPSECLAVEEALDVLTAGGAYQMGLDEKKGTISVDKDADFVIIDNDVLTMEPQRIYTTRVLSTYVHGQKVWSSIQQA